MPHPPISFHFSLFTFHSRVATPSARRSLAMTRTPFQNPNGRDAIHYGFLFSGCLWLVIVFAIFGHVASAFFRSGTTAGWTEVPCYIESSSVERRDVDNFAFTAEYSYYWNGLLRHSTALNRTNVTHYTFSSLADRLPLLEKYAPGTEHRCRVDPANDDTAFLRVKRPGDDASSGVWSVGLVFAIFFLLMVLVGVWQIAEAFPKVRRFWGGRLKKAAFALCMLLFGVPFALGGIVMLFSEALPSFKLTREDLVTVPGKVLYSGIASHSSGRAGRHSTTYSARVGYEYDFQGKKYENDCLDGFAGEYSTSNRRSVRQLADSYRPGSAVEVWVLPSDPRRSTLRPVGGTVKYGTLGGAILFLLVGLALSGGGVFLLLRTLREKRTDQPGVWPLRRSRGTVLFLGAFAGFWNLLAWSAALVFMGEPGPRDPMMMFIWSFPLIGLAMAASFAAALRRDLQAPKLTMTLSLPDGVTPTLDWRLDDPFSVRSLSIQLEGLASAGRGESVDVSLPVCKHAAPLSGTGRETFHFLPADAPKWRLAATLETRTASRPFRLEYPIPETFLP